MERTELEKSRQWIPLAIFGATFLFVLSRVLELQIRIWSFNP